MFEKMPREFNRKRLFIIDMDTFLNHINFFNGKSECFTNTYDYKHTLIDEYGRTKFDRRSIIIDRIPFDFDGTNAYNDMYKLHCYLEVNNLMHIINFSGNGYHVYICTEINDKNTILDVSLFQNNICKKLNLDVDPTIVGNPSHLIRIPGTFNKRRGRFCINLTSDEINTSHEEICELARKQRKGVNTMCDVMFILEHYKSSDTLPDYPTHDIQLEDLDIDIDILIPCLTTNIRTNGYIPHNERVWIVQYLSDVYRNGKHPDILCSDELDSIVFTIVDFFEDIVVDFNRKITESQVRGIVKNYVNSPSCQKLQIMGKCIEGVDCWRRGFK